MQIVYIVVHPEKNKQVIIWLYSSKLSFNGDPTKPIVGSAPTKIVLSKFLSLSAWSFKTSVSFGRRQPVLAFTRIVGTWHKLNGDIVFPFRFSWNQRSSSYLQRIRRVDLHYSQPHIMAYDHAISPLSCTWYFNFQDNLQAIALYLSKGNRPTLVASRLPWKTL